MQKRSWEWLCLSAEPSVTYMYVKGPQWHHHYWCRHGDIIVIDVAMVTSLLLTSPWWHHRYWRHHGDIIVIDVTMHSWYVHCFKRQMLWAEAARLCGIKMTTLEQRLHLWGALETVRGMKWGQGLWSSWTDLGHAFEMMAVRACSAYFRVCSPE